MTSLLALSMMSLFITNNYYCQAQVITIIGQPMVGDQKCRWLKGSQIEVDELPEHNYAVLQDCLYYYLTDRNFNLTGQRSMKKALPIAKSEKMNVKIDQIVIRSAQIDDVLKAAFIYGYVDTTWRDTRLTWNKTEWKSAQLKLNGREIWVPDFGSSVQTSDSVFMYSRIDDAKVSYTGTVKARQDFTASNVPCKMDFQSFPDDKQTCEFYLRDEQFSGLLDYKLSVSPITVHPRYTHNEWKITDAAVVINQPVKGEQELIVNLLISRHSTTLKCILYLPMTVSAGLFLLTPLFGSLKVQSVVKMIVLLLQMMCFALLSETSKSIDRFYELTISLSLVSLVGTLILHGVQERQFKLPVAHNLELAARTLNGKLLAPCTDARQFEENLTDSPKSSWQQVIVALNSLMSLILALAYLTGLILITLYY